MTAKLSMTGEAERLRNHPSVFTFLIGSDFAPDAKIEKGYLDALTAADWQTPVVPAAAKRSSPQLGASGMKMNGPYDWIPPNYWYDKAHSDSGGAWNFNSETSAGPDIPTLDTLNRMMTPAELETLWKNPAADQYHRSESSTFGNLKLFGDALTGRYGAPTNLTDYVKKAQLAAVRERARRVRVAQPQLHRRVEPVDRADLLDAQQRLDVVALAALRRLPGPERCVLRRKEGERAAAHPVLLRHQVRCGRQPEPRGGVRADGVGQAVQHRRDGEVLAVGERHGSG